MNQASREIRIGYELPAITKIAEMSPGAEKFGGSVHTEEGAAVLGLEKVIVGGPTSFGYLTELLAVFFGKPWLSSGELEAKFIAPVHVTDRITAKGTVKEKITEDGKMRLVLDVWCEGPDGQKVTVGTASCLVD